VTQKRQNQPRNEPLYPIRVPPETVLLPFVQLRELLAVRRFMQRQSEAFVAQQWEYLEAGQMFFFNQYQALAQMLDDEPERQAELSFLILYSINCALRECDDPDTYAHVPPAKLTGGAEFQVVCTAVMGGVHSSVLSQFHRQLRDSNHYLWQAAARPILVRCVRPGDGRRLLATLYLLVDRQKELYWRQYSRSCR
jgi:hypothetical protein